jgi:hypothetical protein
MCNQFDIVCTHIISLSQSLVLMPVQGMLGSASLQAGQRRHHGKDDKGCINVCTYPTTILLCHCYGLLVSNETVCNSLHQPRGEPIVDFGQILDRAIEMLQRCGRLSYRALKRQFDLDDGYLKDLKDELLYTQSKVVEDGERETKFSPHTALRGR